MNLTLFKNSSWPSVSVIIPNYNSEPYILHALDSVSKTGYENLEIVIVDDGSSDNSLQCIRENVAEFPEIQFKIYSHPDGKNHGTAETRNLGIQKATGKYLVFLDPDDVFLENRFHTCVDLLESEPEIDAVVEPFVYLFPEGEQSDRYFEITGRKGTVTDPRTAASKSEDLFRDLLNGSLRLHISSLTIRRQAAIESGGFPDIPYAEDWGFLIKVLARSRAKQGTDLAISGYLIHERSLCSKNIDSSEFAFAPIRSMILASNWLQRNRQYNAQRSVLNDVIVQKFYHYCSRLPLITHSLLRDFLRDAFFVAISLPGILFRIKFWKVALKVLGIRFGLSEPWTREDSKGK